MVCDCLIELAHVFFDKTFTYKVPSCFEESICVGMRVEVPFGSQILEGFVMKIYSSFDTSSLKEIISLVDNYPVLNEELLSLGHFIKNSTFSSLMASYQVMLPKALKAKKKVSMNIKKDKYIRLNESYDLSCLKLNNTQTKIIEILKKETCVLKSLLDMVSISSVKTLLCKGVLLLEEREVYRYNLEKSERHDFSLNKEQQKAFYSVLDSFDISNTFLLYGVTGSGKTNVYIKLIEEVLKRGKKALFLVPEISLTPQIISRFTSYFSNIAVLHSRLSDSEKYDEWRRINEGKVDIVIGARSAIFAPLKDIGIIILDEEHSSSYKQENTPKYSALDIAKRRSIYHNCPLILGSATPSIESFSRALRGDYKLLTLESRYNGLFPDISIIDMNLEYKKSNDYFSNQLVSAIKETISRGEQVILFLNKRGFSNVTICRSCGNTKKCPKCDISLTYHKTSNMLRCHYCGYAKKKEDKCDVCGNDFSLYGLGTEKAEETLKKLVPEAKIVRMDIDTTTGKKAHEKIIKSFSNHEYNVLLGTQMIAKGLDFKDVTLVGVINADISLNFPDFRSSEVTYELLSQVAGRSGRADKKGSVLIQTFNKDHYAIKCLCENDYVSFYNEEIKVRKKLNYPPFCYLCLIKVISRDYDIASKMSIKIGDYLKKNVGSETILGPSICNIFKINNEYRFQIIIKYRDINNIKVPIMKLRERFFNDKSVKIDIDLNPMKM